MVTQPSFKLLQHSHYWHGKLANFQRLNKDIVNQFQSLRHQPDKESHYFHGRYENIYIERQRFPALEPLLTIIHKAALPLLPYQERQLDFGFWFNQMQPGDQTTRHCHDDDLEVLSWVYYITAPINAGNLILEPKRAEAITITPLEGHCIFFDPALLHKVSPNLSGQTRLSVAGNFGLKPAYAPE